MKKMFVVLGLFLLVAAATQAVFSIVQQNDTPDPRFSFDPGISGQTYVQVMTGQKMSIPFAFVIDDPVRTVRLELEAGEFRNQGVRLAARTVTVHEGRASSEALFEFPLNQKPGTYRLTIKARDPATGQVVGHGRIPVIYGMEEIVVNCSC